MAGVGVVATAAAPEMEAVHHAGVVHQKLGAVPLAMVTVTGEAAAAGLVGNHGHHRASYPSLASANHPCPVHDHPSDRGGEDLVVLTVLDGTTSVELKSHPSLFGDFGLGEPPLSALQIQRVFLSQREWWSRSLVAM